MFSVFIVAFELVTFNRPLFCVKITSLFLETDSMIGLDTAAFLSQNDAFSYRVQIDC